MKALATNRLQQIAETVKAEHAKIEGAWREGLTRALEVGKLLTEAKGLVKHGEWGKWIADNCQFSERTAQSYMRIADRYPEIAKSATVADLTYREVVGMLAEPRLNFDGVIDLLKQTIELMRRAGRSLDTFDLAVMAETHDKAHAESKKIMQAWEECLKADDLTLSETVTISKQAQLLENRLSACRLTAGYYLGKMLNELEAMGATREGVS